MLPEDCEIGIEQGAPFHVDDPYFIQTGYNELPCETSNSNWFFYVKQPHNHGFQWTNNNIKF